MSDETSPEVVVETWKVQPSGGRREPSADMRLLANRMRQLYEALLDEGFTESQANVLVAETLRATVQIAQSDT